MSRVQDERRATFKQYKEDVEKEGKQFFPYAMFHDTVMSLVVVCVIVGLACIWYFTGDPDQPGEEGTGWLGVIYEVEADPGTTSFTPRPDWYFYFLFYLLRIFKWPDSVILGTVGLPTIALVILIAMPFIDRRQERRLSRRPVAIVVFLLTVAAMGILTYKGATAEEAGAAGTEEVERWMEDENLPEEVRPGAELFAQSGCLNCHTYDGSGASNLGAPDLTDIGAQPGKTVDYLTRYISDPSQFGNNVMPKFASLGEEAVTQMAEFLAASKGTGG
jgi:ubiquinol-cytochrome c reductase cytochrome b subunit/menaquinol-cytochrome c reductase cytochrome b/c subunit